MPETSDSLILVDIANHRHDAGYFRYHTIDARWYLDLAFDKLYGREDDGGEGACKGAREPQSRQRENTIPRTIAGRIYDLAPQALEEEEAARLARGTKEGCANPTV